MRTLNWKHHLGLVKLDVELADRTLSLSVSPVHAAIILHFQSKSESTSIQQLNTAALCLGGNGCSCCCAEIGLRVAGGTTWKRLVQGPQSKNDCRSLLSVTLVRILVLW